MISPADLYQFLAKQGVTGYAGVPDSLLKHFLKYLQDHSSEHTITANEGLAIGLAAGYHLATGKVPLVYLQNSGLGNIINPLTSLADKEVYGIPVLLLIGWRGRPGTKDEPQHVKMGRITVPLLDTLEVPVYILEEEQEKAFGQISDAINKAKAEQRPVALLVPEEIFEVYKGEAEQQTHSLEREEVIRQLIEHLTGDEVVVCTTGKAGREFYEQNKMTDNKINKYLLSVGAMGHANHVALGIRKNSGERVVMLDGDGALLMQMGSLATIGQHVNDGFLHIVINNGSHESVGGQPTEGFAIDLCSMASASGYTQVIRISNESELQVWLKEVPSVTGKQFVEILTNKKSRPDLGRPAGSPTEWKNDLMTTLLKSK
jgi:phosphonopyruvate decarboxylase